MDRIPVTDPESGFAGEIVYKKRCCHIAQKDGVTGEVYGRKAEISVFITTPVSMGYADEILFSETRERMLGLMYLVLSAGRMVVLN